MKVRLLTLIFFVQSLSFVGASSMLSLQDPLAKKIVKVSELTPENFYQELLQYEQMKAFAAFFNPETNRERVEAVISFMKEQLDEHTDLSSIHFFEIFKQIFQDPTVNSLPFREFVSHLQSNEKTAGIMLVHQLPAKQAAFHTPSSLTNHGNTCFLNSMIQALLPIVKNSFHQVHEGDLNTTRRLFLNFLKARTRNENEKGENELERFVDHAWRRLFQGQRGRQQDAYNFLNGLLTHLAPVEYLDMPQQVADLDMAEQVPDLNDMFDRAFLNLDEQDVHQREALVFAELLAIRQQSVKTVPTHLTENSSKAEILSNLDLPLNGRKKLEEAIHDYFEPEQLDDYKVDGKVTPATKQLRLNQAGKVVILNLKRYQHDGAAGTRINTPTEFPLVDLDLSLYFADATKSPGNYELSAVVMHIGSSLNSGHYITYVRGDLDGRPTWFYCSDSSVYPIADDEMARIAYRGYGTDAQCLPTTFFYTLAGVTPKLSSENIALFMAAYNKAGKVCIKKLPIQENTVSAETEKYVVTPLENLLTQPIHPIGPAVIKTPQAQFSWTDPQVLITATALLIACGYIHKKEVEAKEKEEKEKKENIRKLLLARVKLPSMAVTSDPTVPPTAA